LLREEVKKDTDSLSDSLIDPWQPLVAAALPADAVLLAPVAAVASVAPPNPGANFPKPSKDFHDKSVDFWQVLVQRDLQDASSLDWEGFQS
jgi:hypothetical protein